LDNISFLKTSLADLFISTDGWNPFGSAPYTNDNFDSPGEDWVFVLKMGAGNTANLYSTATGSVILSNSTVSTFRNRQEVGRDNGTLIASASASYEIFNNGSDPDTDDFIRYKNRNRNPPQTTCNSQHTKHNPQQPTNIPY
jgi:hypothetical protein